MQTTKEQPQPGNLRIYESIQDELLEVKALLASTSHSNDPDIQKVISYTVEGVGKMLRPAIAILASKFHPLTDLSKVVSMATAVELLHLASLVHDDTVDQSETRRGRITVSDRWGKDVALLVGDYLFATSATVMCETENIKAMHIFSQTIKEVSHGELSENLSAYDWHQTREQYFDRIYHKTASLFATAAEGGALVSEAPNRTVDSLRTYGMNLGLAFQIVDDILDFEGDEKVIGKPIGNDLAQGVLTLPSILLIEQSPSNNPVFEIFDGNNNQENIQHAIQMIQSSSIISDCYEIAKQFSQKAHEALENLEDNVYRRSLSSLASYVLQRDS